MDTYIVKSKAGEERDTEKVNKKTGRRVRLYTSPQQILDVTFTFLQHMTDNKINFQADEYTTGIHVIQSNPEYGNVGPFGLQIHLILTI